MPDGIGPNELEWREYSRKILAIAMTWTADKQIRFTQHHKFQNLTLADQELLFGAIQQALPPSKRQPNGISEVKAPLSRRPASIAPTTQPVSLKLPWHRNAFVAAALHAVAWWLATMAVGDLILKFVMVVS